MISYKDMIQNRTIDEFTEEDLDNEISSMAIIEHN